MTEEVQPADLVIVRSSPVPLYFQLAEQLERNIRSGHWPPGSKLPTELELGERSGLSRTTVRQSLARLEQRGLIDRRQGQGTFVERGERGLWLLESAGGFLQDEIEDMGRLMTSQILRAERGPLPDWACQVLELPLGSSGATLERVRAVDGLAALYVLNHVPERLADVTLAMSNPNESLYRWLREKTGVAPSGGRRTVEAVAAGPQIADLLEAEPGTPVASIESVVWDAEMRPFYCYRAYIRTDRIRVDIRL